MIGLTIAGRTFGSRLLVGTGKFSSNQAMASCLEASGTEIVTVALRRAAEAGAVCVLGSATPALESGLAAQAGRLKRVAAPGAVSCHSARLSNRR